MQEVPSTGQGGMGSGRREHCLGQMICLNPRPVPESQRAWGALSLGHRLLGRDWWRAQGKVRGGSERSYRRQDDIPDKG